MRNTHKGQILPIINQMIPIDKETTFHASYDKNINGMRQEEIIQPRAPLSSLYFDGSSYITCEGTHSSGKVTIEFWMKSESKPAYNAILDMGGTTSIIHEATGQITFRVPGVDVSYWGGHGASVPYGEWHHVACIYTGTHRLILIDGIEKARQAITTSTVDISKLRIGIPTSNAAGYFHQGSLAELKIWSIAKTTDDVKRNMNKTLSGKENNLLVYYRMNEKEGPITIDHSDNKNDGVWTGNLIASEGQVIATQNTTKGKFNGSVLIEPETTNLWTGGFTVYNNYGVPSSIVKTGELYLGQPVWRIGMMVDDAHADKLGHFQTSLSSHGVYGGSLNWEQDTMYNSSIYWRSVNKPDMVFGGTASNTGGWASGGNQTSSGEWQRYYRHRTGTGVATKSDVIHHSFYCPSLQLNEWIYFDVCCPQTESGRTFPTSYVEADKSRPTGKLWYQSDIINQNSFTISCWFNAPHIHTVNAGNTGIQGNWYQPIIDIAPETNNGDVGLSIVITPAANYSPTRKLELRNPRTGGTGSYTGTTTINDNEWNHMSLTYDGTIYKGYLNGKLEFSYTAPPQDIADDMFLMIGGGYYGKPFIKIDEVRIESRAITSEEAAAWAASGLHYNYLDYSTI